VIGGEGCKIGNEEEVVEELDRTRLMVVLEMGCVGVMLLVEVKSVVLPICVFAWWLLVNEPRCVRPSA
jgi:hypothetical protein